MIGLVVHFLVLSKSTKRESKIHNFVSFQGTNDSRTLYQRSVEVIQMYASHNRGKVIISFIFDLRPICQ